MACADDPAAIHSTFDARGISTVVVRADRAEQLLVHTDTRVSDIRIWGTPVGGDASYHPVDPDSEGTSPNNTHLGFVGKIYGDVLVIAVQNEISQLDRGYRLDALNIILPPRIKVVRDRSALDADGAPDLRPPEQA